MVRSAGLVLVRRAGRSPEVLLVHPGGPFFAKRDDGVWSIPKGIVEPGEDPLAAARREVREEIGLDVDPARTFVPLGELALRKGKRVVAWAVAADFDPTALVSGTFELEWPPRSGRRASFPEVDRAAWLRGPDALRKIAPAQGPLVERALSAEVLGALLGE